VSAADGSRKRMSRAKLIGIDHVARGAACGAAIQERGLCPRSA
jgi:hypothetical protein